MRHPFSFEDFFAKLGAYLLQQAISEWIDESLESTSLPILAMASVLIGLWVFSWLGQSVSPSGST